MVSSTHAQVSSLIAAGITLRIEDEAAGLRCAVVSSGSRGYIEKALAALGLVDALPLKPRTLGFLGVTASVMNIYLLLPGSFKPQLKAKRG